MQVKENKYFFVINPSANCGRVIGIWKQAEAYLQGKYVQFEAAFSHNDGQVAMLAKEAAAQGFIVVGVGGDGTISKIASALTGRGTPMGVIPAGTGNDFARTFALPEDPVEACKVILQGYSVWIDLGRFNGHGFCNVVGAGLDAEVVADANRTFKPFSGPVAYVLALFRQLFSYKPRLLYLDIDGRQYQVRGWLVSVANAKYIGGGMMIAAKANPSDGLLDVVVVSDISRFHFIRLFPRVYKGTHLNHQAVLSWRGARIQIKCETGLSVQADGEIVGTTPLTVEVEAKAVRLLVPKSYKSPASCKDQTKKEAKLWKKS